MARRNDIPDAGHPKRRRLDNSPESGLPYVYAVPNTALEQDKEPGAFVKGAGNNHGKRSQSCVGDVEASEISPPDNGWSECCYGMVRGCRKYYSVALLTTLYSFLAFMCDFDTNQTLRIFRCLPSLFPSSGLISFPPKVMGR